MQKQRRQPCVSGFFFFFKLFLGVVLRVSNLLFLGGVGGGVGSAGGGAAAVR